MSNLVEDVLIHIFDYLAPLEWIQVSQVCELWKTTAAKQWRKITEITYLEREIELRYHLKKAPYITATDSERIITLSAPYVEVLSASSGVFGNETLIKLGPFSYMVRGFNPDATLLLLSRNATNITEIRFDVPPRVELLRLLISTNKISKVAFGVCGAFYETIPTDDIEELNASFYDSDNIKSFAGHFPKLKKIDLTLDCRFSPDLRQTLSPVLSHIDGVTSLALHIMFVRHPISCKGFLDIVELLKLEQLFLEFDKTNRTSHVEFFVKKLATCCPRLRELKLLGMMISETDFPALLTLPRLESLHVGRVSNLDLIVQPRMINLSELRINSDCTKPNVKQIVNVLKKMPRLKLFELTDTDLLDSALKNRNMELERFAENQMLQLVCDLATVAVLQEKDIIVNKSYDSKNPTELKIVRSNDDEEAPTTNNRVLNIRVLFYDEIAFYEDIRTFVQTELIDHEAVIVERENTLRI